MAYLPDKESETNWTIKGSILYLRYAAENDVVDVIDTYKNTFENNVSDAKMKVLEISKDRKKPFSKWKIYRRKSFRISRNRNYTMFLWDMIRSV